MGIKIKDLSDDEMLLDVIKDQETRWDYFEKILKL